MANEEHLAILKKGAMAWNEWRERNPTLVPDLSGASLGYSHLEGANLRGAVLERADFRQGDLRSASLEGANLSRALLCGADFTGANFRGASLGSADCWEAGLAGAELDHAGLMFTDFRRAYLAGASMAGAGMGCTTFAEVDLSGVRGLETVRHAAPSTIGIDTIFRSKGKIPEVFLRGAGVPDQFITYMKSLAANPIEFYSCFISYSTANQGFAEQLYADLQSRNVPCWFAPHDVQGGKKLHEQIDEAIRAYEKVLLILSTESMSSEWVKTEIAKTRKREVREKKRMLFPVRLVGYEALRDWECFDADTGKDSAREIREYFIPDFSEWKDHDKYTKAFERLLGDLKAGERSRD